MFNSTLYELLFKQFNAHFRVHGGVQPHLFGLVLALQEFRVCNFVDWTGPTLFYGSHNSGPMHAVTLLHLQTSQNGEQQEDLDPITPSASELFWASKSCSVSELHQQLIG